METNLEYCAKCKTVQTPIIEAEEQNGWRWRCPHCSEWNGYWYTREEAQKDWNKNSQMHFTDLERTAKALDWTIEELRETLDYEKRGSKLLSEYSALPESERADEKIKELYIKHGFQS